MVARYATVVILALALAACSTSRDPSELFAPDGGGTLVIDAVLVVDLGFPDIFLTRTFSPTGSASLDQALPGIAEVVVRWGTGEMAYLPAAFQPFRFVPERFATVQEQTRYTVTVRTDRGEVLTATTTTPRRFRAREWVLLNDSGGAVVRNLETFRSAGDSVYTKNTLTYADGIVEARFDRADYEGFQVALFSLDLGSDLIVDPDFIDEEDLDRENASPPLTADDGKIRLPWLAVYYGGRHKIKLFAIDRNWLDLARTDPTIGAGGFGFGGNAGDSFERPIFHVDGGIGLFGSAAVDSTGFFVQPRP